MKKISRLRFAHLPTPVESLPRLSAYLGGPTLLVKRDDQTGLAFGGNKTRKLEYLLAEAEAAGARTVITAGAVQSNHCRQTAAAAARFGFQCTLVLTGRPPEDISGNLLLDRLLGAEVVYSKGEERSQMLQRVFEESMLAGRKPYLIPYGGSNAVGAAAYAFAFKELLDQGVRPDWILFASSSGGTQAGLVLGKELFDGECKILGISVDQPRALLQEQVAKLAGETAERLGESFTFTPDQVQVNDAYLGAGYGVMGEPEREAIRAFAQYEGLLLDPVYTGRAAAGLIDLIRKGFFHPGQTVLFWHTGGGPALFASKYRSLLAG